MSIRMRLIIMNFLEFFVWGSWLISLGGYLIGVLKFSGGQVGAIYGTMGLASLFMPALMGIVADRWVNAERVLGGLHLIGAALLLWASTIHSVDQYPLFYLIMLFNSMAFMPTIAMNNTVSYSILQKNGLEVVKDFPPIRVWGTVGFIVAMWMIDFLDLTKSAAQLYVSAGSGIVLGIYAFTMPSCPPSSGGQQKTWIQALGLDAFVLLKQQKMLVFFIFSLLLGAALQITNAFGGAFLDDFKQSYPDSFGVKHPNLLLSISQISETLFILTIPFFLQRFGIKRVMLMSMIAWVFRFGLFGIGNPGDGLHWLVLSMIIYGMAFDFFNISGSLFVEKEADSSIRASAQGLFMIMTNGIGAYLGGSISGWVVDYFTTVNPVTQEIHRDWPSIWYSFAGYALVLSIFFPLLFRYKHEQKHVVTEGELVD